MSKMKRIMHNGMGHVRGMFSPKMAHHNQYQPNQSNANKPWLDLQYRDVSKTSIKKPDELEKDMQEPPVDSIDKKILDRIAGSMVGMALGDALGAHVEFRPHQYMLANPVTDLEGGGTWGLRKGQFTDDTSMALCLANSLVIENKFNPYDQLVRYKWWYRNGYMSSTGECFDIGAATRQSIHEFERRQNAFAEHFQIPREHIDHVSGEEYLSQFNVYCSEQEVAGNGALMRLAPVPLFFYRSPERAVEYSGYSGQITHGDTKAYDACRYYGALIVAALRGYKKDELLNDQFYSKHEAWFAGKPLCTEIQQIAQGSYKRKGGYRDGIRGKGYIVNALEAALWAFWSDNNSFETGALAAVNLGDDTDTTAAIYGQLAGAHYGYEELPQRWRKQVYAEKFILNLSRWIAYGGQIWKSLEDKTTLTATSPSQLPMAETFTNEPNLNTQPKQYVAVVPLFNSSSHSDYIQDEIHQNKSKLRSFVSEASSYHSIPSGPSAMIPRPLNYHRTDAHMANRPHPDVMNTRSSRMQSQLSNQSSALQTSALPTVMSRRHEKTSAHGAYHGPPLCATQTVCSKEEYHHPSAHSKSKVPSIPDSKKSQIDSKVSSQGTTSTVPSAKKYSDQYSSNNGSNLLATTRQPVSIINNQSNRAESLGVNNAMLTTTKRSRSTHKQSEGQKSSSKPSQYPTNPPYIVNHLYSRTSYQ